MKNEKNSFNHIGISSGLDKHRKYLDVRRTAFPDKGLAVKNRRVGESAGVNKQQEVIEYQLILGWRKNMVIH